MVFKKNWFGDPKIRVSYGFYGAEFFTSELLF